MKRKEEPKEEQTNRAKPKQEQKRIKEMGKEKEEEGVEGVTPEATGGR